MKNQASGKNIFLNDEDISTTRWNDNPRGDKYIMFQGWKANRGKIPAAIAATLSLLLIAGCMEVPYGDTGPVYTTFFTDVSPEEAYEIISTSVNITIIDIRGCKCDYNKGHIPTANWSLHATQFYNTTNDLLIYDQDGTNSTEFCEKLVNHTYGAIYRLKGGIDAWIAAGYEIT